MTPKATSCLRGMYVHNLSHYNISYNLVVVGWVLATVQLTGNVARRYSRVPQWNPP